mmetsp:Transcript_4218/g.8109  ORF Transcript_4218/g.8109 Transcript_4218/m.8109 type:complete len:205 (-) Transcript_4218:1127-1741(-)
MCTTAASAFSVFSAFSIFSPSKIGSRFEIGDVSFRSDLFVLVGDGFFLFAKGRRPADEPGLEDVPVRLDPDLLGPGRLRTAVPAEEAGRFPAEELGLDSCSSIVGRGNTKRETAAMLHTGTTGLFSSAIPYIVTSLTSSTCECIWVMVLICVPCVNSSLDRRCFLMKSIRTNRTPLSPEPFLSWMMRRRASTLKPLGPPSSSSS